MAQEQTQTNNKRRLVRGTPAAAVPSPAKHLEEGNDEDAPGLETKPAELEEEAAPKVKTRKQADAELAAALKEAGKAKKPVGPLVKPTDDLIRKKNGEPFLDEDGEEMRYAPGFHNKGVGFVNESGVRFPPGYKFRGGFIGSFGNVIMNRCPECGYQNSIDDARTGKCGNQKCGYDAVSKLEGIEPE